jgi:predicted porin
MKRSIFLAALATLTSGAALAQSSVTVYGRLNESVERQKDGDTTLTALQNNASRIGFKGTEDLGGGLKASFLIEHGFNADTGAASGGAASFWGRESWVGLEGAFGKVRLGNVGFGTAAYFATADYISMHNHDTGTSSDAFYLYPGAPLTNVIAYATPNIAGFTAEGQFGLKESTKTKNTFVLAGNYDAGPLHLGASYVSAPTGLFTPPASDDSKEFGIRGLYEMGPFTVGAYYVNNKLDDGAGNSLKRNAVRVSAMYAMGASEFHVNVGKAGDFKANGTAIDGTGATQYTIAYNYNLSKRTKVYAFYTGVNNKDNAAYNVSVDGTKFSSLALGLRHNF